MSTPTIIDIVDKLKEAKDENNANKELIKRLNSGEPLESLALETMGESVTNLMNTVEKQTIIIAGLTELILNLFERDKNTDNEFHEVYKFLFELILGTNIDLGTLTDITPLAYEAYTEVMDKYQLF